MPEKNRNFLGLVLLAVVLVLSLIAVLFVQLTRQGVLNSLPTVSPPPPTSTAPAFVPNLASLSDAFTTAPGYKLLASNSIATGHTASVVEAAFSPDGQHLATVSTDTLLKLWDVNGDDNPVVSPANCSTFYNYPYPLVSLAWSPDGKTLATGDTDGGLKLWSLPCTSSPISLSGIQGAVRTVAFSPDGSLLASGGADNIVRLWDVTSQKLLYSFDNGRSGINSVRWSPDGTRLAFVSTKGQLVLLKISNGKLEMSDSLAGPGGSLRSLAWSPDGHWIAAGDSSGGITVWDSKLTSTTLRFEVAANDVTVHSLAFSPDSTTLADGSSDTNIKLWKISTGATGEPVILPGLNLTGHRKAVRSVAFSPTGKFLVSASDDQSVRLWNTSSGTLLGTLAGPVAYQTTANWSANSNFVVTGAADGKIREWQSSNLQLLATITASSSGAVRSTAISPDSRWFAETGDDGQLKLWSWPLIDGQAPLIITPTLSGPTQSVAFSPDSNELATSGNDGKIRLWKWDGKNLNLIKVSSQSLRPIRSLAFTANGSELVSGGDDGHLRVWNTINLQLLRDWQAHDGYVKTLALDSKSSIIASAGGDGSVRLWDIATGKLRGGTQYQNVIEGLTISPDGQNVAVSTDDGDIHLWSVDTRKPYFTITGQGLSALALTFASDGKRLAATTKDGALQVWSTNLSGLDSNQPDLPTAPTLVATPANSPFVTIGPDGHFSLDGQRVLLKGFNFYPRLASFGSMWLHWNGQQAASDLDKAKELGANSLRILIPYGTGFGWTASDGTPDATMLDELEQVVSLADQRNMRVLLTLYDFYGEFPLAHTPEEAANWRYLDAIIAKYQADPRILGWDLHNEPDNYASWQVGNQNQVLDWLERVSLHLRQRDSNHFVTIGFGDWHNLSFAAPDGITALALSDVVALHAYTPTLLNQQIAEVAAASGPIPTFLEEFGWPSAPTEQTSDYSEAQQAQHYKASLDAVTAKNLDGAMAWSLWDFSADSVLNLRPNIAQQFFGLVRLNGSLKPAATVWQQAFVASSFSAQAVKPVITLTERAVDPNLYPQYFDATGYAVATPFKEYWSRMGGLESFGYPISEVHLEGGYLVQYFERARFEYHPENTTASDYAGLSRTDQLKRIVLLGLLSNERLAQQQRTFPVALPQAKLVYFPQTKHNLGDVFKEYWETHGGLARFGFPISEEVQEVSATDGKTYTVQYFERARLEYHPELSGTPYIIELGQLGRELLSLK